MKLAPFLFAAIGLMSTAWCDGSPTAAPTIPPLPGRGFKNKAYGKCLSFAGYKPNTLKPCTCNAQESYVRFTHKQIRLQGATANGIVYLPSNAPAAGVCFTAEYGAVGSGFIVDPNPDVGGHCDESNNLQWFQWTPEGYLKMHPSFGDDLCMGYSDGKLQVMKCESGNNKIVWTDELNNLRPSSVQSDAPSSAPSSLQFKSTGCLAETHAVMAKIDSVIPHPTPETYNEDTGPITDVYIGDGLNLCKPGYRKAPLASPAGTAASSDANLNFCEKFGKENRDKLDAYGSPLLDAYGSPVLPIVKISVSLDAYGYQDPMPGYIDSVSFFVDFCPDNYDSSKTVDVAIHLEHGHASTTEATEHSSISSLTISGQQYVIDDFSTNIKHLVAYKALCKGNKGTYRELSYEATCTNGGKSVSIVVGSQPKCYAQECTTANDEILFKSFTLGPTEARAQKEMGGYWDCEGATETKNRTACEKETLLINQDDGEFVEQSVGFQPKVTDKKFLFVFDMKKKAVDFEGGSFLETICVAKSGMLVKKNNMVEISCEDPATSSSKPSTFEVQGLSACIGGSCKQSSAAYTNSAMTLVFKQKMVEQQIVEENVVCTITSGAAMESLLTIAATTVVSLLLHLL